MAKIQVRKDEDIDKVLRKFKTKLRREGMIDELKKREFYEKPSQRRRQREEKAKRKEVKRRQNDQW
ncbi:MAG: 30S ribosomal protein S21 [Candidatus Margulisbacteria bacterium]|nr:30S ribosomal protein S21 [Candidatus Margulisiibacteriota bacterium]MBU1021323.1 30S ribosomal protein S21 [Candidatus Margulisiibacteriota bacterium]MBU1729188.1 30S ribosomal protein S21 [Candidatus Margulisiibacteriota bacterium]MBU1954861.1 30S ribosomal protein S21 [Candidatus Margulisiibacteriota bacterium]